MASIESIGLAGYKQALESANKNVDKVLAGFSGGDFDQAVGGFVGLSQDRRAAQASLKVIKVGDNLQQSILDILA